MQSVAVLQPRFDRRPSEPSLRPVEAEFEEAKALVRAIDLDPVHTEIIPVREINPATLLGSGGVERLGAILKEKKIKLVFVNAALAPIQQRNLEKTWKVKVIDRQGLILEIFAARAKTHEGRLQVELAALTYQRSMLVRLWSHLERQRGGLGKTGGPGEMQKELDRRKLEEKIKTVKRDLDKVVQNRAVQRAARERVPFPIVALVGYTNAGKSTLFNRLTKEEVLAKDLLFATLDTTLRALKLPSGRMIILSDTVGFISQLPPELVAAFRATLEETIHADIILHVRDIAAPYSEAERQDVMTTLDRMALDKETPIWEVWNKIDLLDEETKSHLTEKRQRSAVPVIAASAVTGEGLADLLQALDDNFALGEAAQTITLRADEGERMAWLYRHARITDKQEQDGHIILQLRISPQKLAKFNSLPAMVAHDH